MTIKRRFSKKRLNRKFVRKTKRNRIQKRKSIRKRFRKKTKFMKGGSKGMEEIVQIKKDDKPLGFFFFRKFKPYGKRYVYCKDSE